MLGDLQPVLQLSQSQLAQVADRYDLTEPLPESVDKWEVKEPIIVKPPPPQPLPSAPREFSVAFFCRFNLLAYESV